MQIPCNFSELWLLFYIVLDNHKALRNTFPAITFKVEENSRTFQGLAMKFKNFSRKSGIHMCNIIGDELLLNFGVKFQQ